MTAEEIVKALESHKKWLQGKEDGVKLNWSGKDLRYADLRYADLSNADLSNADLRYADLSNADLSNAKNFTYIPMYLPEGEFIAYKKIKDNQNNKYIVKLRILAISKRSRATGDKCRCDMARVEEIQDMDGNKLDIAEVEHYGYKQITYKVGELVKADGWNENRFVECTNGIHFFVDRQSAVNYKL